MDEQGNEDQRTPEQVAEECFGAIRGVLWV